jgi:hypothetical protein
MNRVKSFDKINNIPKPLEEVEEPLYDHSVLCSNPKVVTIEDKLKKINLLTNPGESKRRELIDKGS